MRSLPMRHARMPIAVAGALLLVAIAGACCEETDGVALMAGDSVVIEPTRAAAIVDSVVIEPGTRRTLRVYAR